MTTLDKDLVVRALIECPFCGDFDGIGYGVDDFDGTAVVCGNCDHVGPGAEPGNREEAMRLWKDRPTIVAVAARLTALRAENEALEQAHDTVAGALAEATKQNEALRAEVERKDAALREAADEIDAYIRQEYPLDHPVHERYRERDFAANPARAALSPARKGDV